MAPNILLLHCHDLGRFLGSYGVDTVQSPHLDRLASEGVVFDNAFATAPHCSPARASLFTGLYPQSHGVLGLAHDPFGWDLRNPGDHIARHLADHGYRTELLGVHHESRDLPDAEVAARLGFNRVRTGGERDLVAGRAVEVLEASAATGEPFYLQVGFTEPHRTPSARDAAGVMGFLGAEVQPDDSLGITVPAHLRDDAGAREEMAELQGAVAYMDAGVGQILDRLRALGLAENTVVVFTTDHGLALPGAKCTLYDAGVGVALMIRAPGHAWAGRRVQDLVSHVDVLPTLCELVGVPRPAGREGESLVPLIAAERAGRALTFSQLTHHTYYDPKRSVRSARHKLIANFSNAPRAMDPTQSWVHRSLPAGLSGPTIGTSPAVELFDLDEDPHEQHNRAADPTATAILGTLAAALLAWMAETGDPLLAEVPEAGRHRQTLDLLTAAAQAAASEPAIHPLTRRSTDAPFPKREERTP